jgi:hypothetical protein
MLIDQESAILRICGLRARGAPPGGRHAAPGQTVHCVFRTPPTFKEKPEERRPRDRSCCCARYSRGVRDLVVFCARCTCTIACVICSMCTKCAIRAMCGIFDVRDAQNNKVPWGLRRRSTLSGNIRSQRPFFAIAK